jgi:radical SAM protein with 4Fe4S-binding SPASM domain
MKQGVNTAHCMITGPDIYDGYLIDNHMHISRLGLIPDFALVRDIDTWDITQADIFINDYRMYVDFIKDVLKDTDFKNFPGLIKYSLNNILSYHILDEPARTCGIDTGNYTSILPDGTVSSCERFSRNKQTFNKEHLKYLDECNSCDIRNYCNKGCIYEQIQNKGCIDELCLIYKGMYQVNIDLIKYLDKNLLKNFTNFIKE